MSGAAFGFYAAAVLALLGGLAAVLLRRREHALAGFAIAAAAVLVPLIQLHATAVAAVVLLAAALALALLGAIVRLDRGAPVGERPSRALGYWIPAGAGLLGFVWVLLATGSRQVVDLGDPLPRGRGFGDGDRLLVELADGFVVPALLIALLALCAVIAAVLGLVRKAH